MVARGGFEYRGDHVVCSQGKILKWAAYHRRNASYQYVARQKDRQACPIKEQCLPPHQKRRYLGLTIYYPLHLQAQERNRTPAYRREMARNLAGKPLAGFRAMTSRRITVLYSIIIYVIRCKNPLLHR